MSNKLIKEAKINTSSKEKKKTEPKKLQQNVSSTGFGVKNIVAAVLAVVVVFACIFVGYDQMKAKVLLTVGEEKLTLKDLGYYIYQGEKEGNYYASMYEQFYGAGYDYWNEEGEDGTTQAENMGEAIMQEAIYDETLYLKATESGYTATDNDIKTATEQRDELAKELTKKQKMIRGLSSSELYDVLLKKAIADRYKTDVITGFGLDYDEITADIKEKDYKQYDFQYYHVSTTTTNDDGESVSVSDDEKANLKARMDELAVSAETAEDFTKLLGEDEETITFNENGQLIEKDGFDEKIDKKIKKMSKDEVSDVLEGEDGYYLIKLIDNTSKESYETAVETAKTNAEEEAFEEEYTNNIEPGYVSEINYDEWDYVKIGSYCY